MPNEQPNKMWSGRFREPLNRTFGKWQRNFPFDWRLLPLAALELCSLHSFSQQLIKQEEQQTTLAGTIKLVHDYGPPGYGEDPKHDAHVSYWALVPPDPVNFPCTPEKQKFADTDCAPAKQINLYFAGFALKRLNELPAAKWNGQQVIIEGKLHRADTVGEMTPIYMDVSAINAAPPHNVAKK